MRRKRRSRRIILKEGAKQMYIQKVKEHATNMSVDETLDIRLLLLHQEDVG
jgi:hypothetical protein